MKPLLFLDLEMNQPSGKIIQIGYVIIDMDVDQTLCSKRIYVNPNEKLNPTIETLTGISQAQVDSAPTLEQAYIELVADVVQHKPFINPVTWGGGDSAELRKQLCMDDERFVFGRRWIDAKTIYVAYALANNLPYAGGLFKVMSRFKLGFIGRAHDALTDATNTYRLYKHLLTLFKKAL